MKILVTGGAGFIGSAFIRYWVGKYPKDKLINVDKLTYAGNLENLSDIEVNVNYTFIKGDIGNRRLMVKALKEVDCIVNVAAESHVDRSILDSGPFIETNINGTVNLLEVARENNVKKFIHFSTDEVFGALELDSKDKFTERSPHKPRSPYAASKAAAEDLARAYAITYDLPLVILNCSNNFGPYQFPEKFIPLSIINALENRKIPIYGDGLYVRDWVYVEDTVTATETVIKKGKVGETYLVSADTEKSNIEVAKKILKILGKSESLLTTIKDRPGHDRRYALDANKIKKELDWKPNFSNFDRSLELTIKWYKENNKWIQRVRNKKYMKYYDQQYGKY